MFAQWVHVIDKSGEMVECQTCGAVYDPAEG